MKFLVRALLFGLVRLLVGAHARWEGCGPERRPRIYFANHSSHLDTLVILAALPAELRAETHPMAALDYWGKSVWRRFLAVDCLNAVLLDRAPRRSEDPLAPAEAILEQGHSLILFPEGTRGEGEIASFKPGLFHLARRFPDAELVPVYMENLFRILPKGTALLVPLICSLTFGTPLRRLEEEAKSAFLERGREALMALAAGMGSSKKEG